MNWVLLLHIASASVLFGSGLVTAMALVVSMFGRDVGVIAAAARRVVLADWCLTVPSGMIQFVTGVYLGWSQDVLTAGWFLWAVGLYVMAGVCWLPVVVYQIRMEKISACSAASGRLPREFYVNFWKWFVLGFPAFIGLVVVFWLMVARP